VIAIFLLLPQIPLPQNLLRVILPVNPVQVRIALPFHPHLRFRRFLHNPHLRFRRFLHNPHLHNLFPRLLQFPPLFLTRPPLLLLECVEMVTLTRVNSVNLMRIVRWGTFVISHANA